MSKILFSTMANIVFFDELQLDPFYEAMISELKRLGNDVQTIFTNQWIARPLTSNKVHSKRKKRQLIEFTKEFEPEIIITSNHSIPSEVLENTECPVLVYTADAPQYFVDPEYIRRNISRYFFIQGFDKTLQKACVDIFGCKESQNIVAGYASAVKAYPKEKTDNISFIGTVGWTAEAKRKFLECNDQGDFEGFLKEFNLGVTDPQHWRSDFLHVVTSNSRIKALDAISDLGLKVYGYKQNFCEVISYSMELLKCFDFKPVVTLSDTECVLNSTKIVPNLANGQSSGGLSWRVPDVMGSSACLISVPKNDLEHISKYVKIPTFESPSECRELTIKLLEDEVWRKDIVDGSNLSIDETSRFKHFFERINNTIGEVIEIKDLNIEATSSRVASLRPLGNNPILNITKTSVRALGYRKAKMVYRSLKPLFDMCFTSSELQGLTNKDIFDKKN